MRGIPRSHRFARSRPLTLCEGGVRFPPFTGICVAIRQTRRGAATRACPYGGGSLASEVADFGFEGVGACLFAVGACLFF